MRIKLFEQYNKEETLLGLAKMGLRTNRREVFDLAVKRGLDKKAINSLQIHCMKNKFYKSMEWLFDDKELYQSLMDNITFLDLRKENIKDFSNYSMLRNVEIIYSGWNKNFESIKGIEVFTKLRLFRCMHNNLTDITPLSGLTNLEELSIQSCNLKDITPLSNLTKLNILYLSNNNISDITPLKDLHTLKWLYINNNNLTDMSALKYHIYITILSFDGNPLPDSFYNEVDPHNDTLKALQEYYSE